MLNVVRQAANPPDFDEFNLPLVLATAAMASLVVSISALFLCGNCLKKKKKSQRPSQSDTSGSDPTRTNPANEHGPVDSQQSMQVKSKESKEFGTQTPPVERRKRTLIEQEQKAEVAEPGTSATPVEKGPQMTKDFLPPDITLTPLVAKSSASASVGSVATPKRRPFSEVSERSLGNAESLRLMSVSSERSYQIEPELHESATATTAGAEVSKNDSPLQPSKEEISLPRTTSVSAKTSAKSSKSDSSIASYSAQSEIEGDGLPRTSSTDEWLQNRQNSARTMFKE